MIETKVINNREAITGFRGKETSAIKSTDEVPGSSSSSSSAHDLAKMLQNYNRTTRVRTYNPEIRQFNSGTATLLHCTLYSFLKAFFLLQLSLHLLQIRSAVAGSTLH